jgi:hypothetical protein
MREFKSIFLVAAFLVTCIISAAAQTSIAVVTARASRVSRGIAANNGSSDKYNQRVAPKNSPLTHGPNRLLNPQTKTPYFPIAPHTTLIDSKGKKRDEIAASEVRINFGGIRMMKGVNGKISPHVNVFSTGLANGEVASGYASLTAFSVKPKMPVVTAKRPPAGARTPYTVTGGNLSKFGVTDSNGQFRSLKVNKKITKGGQNATDYLLRPGGYVNQTYNIPGTKTGGIAYDSYKVGTTFYRAPSVKAVREPLYHQGGTKVAGHLTFVYGTVSTPTGKRHGWMALEALKRKHLTPSHR